MGIWRRLGVAIGVLAAAGELAAADFRELARNAVAVIELDIDSVRREQQVVLYRIHSRPFAPDRYNHYVGHVAANCEKRTRSEIRRTDLSGDGTRSASTPEAPWRPAAAGREARELALACSVAEKGKEAAGPAPARRPVVSTTGDKSLSTQRQATTGILVSAQGHVLAPSQPLLGCDDFRITTLAGTRPGRRAAPEALAGFVLLQAEGGPYRPLQARGGLLPRESALTVIGFAPDARPGASPWVTVAYVSSDPPGTVPDGPASAAASASAEPKPKPWITVAAELKLGAGPVLDDRGQVVGWLRNDGVGEDGRPRGLVMMAEPLRHVLDYHGIDWQGDPAPAGQAVRRGAHGTVLVACSTPR